MESKPKIDVRYVADLARLHLTDDETSELQRQLDEIVGYVDQLAELDVDGIEPTAHATPLRNVMRADEVRACDIRAAAIDNAPAIRDDLFVVPKIIE